MKQRKNRVVKKKTKRVLLLNKRNMLAALAGNTGVLSEIPPPVKKDEEVK